MPVNDQDDKTLNISDPQAVEESRRQSQKLEEISESLREFGENSEMHYSSMNSLMDTMASEAGVIADEIQKMRAEDQERWEEEQAEKRSERKDGIIERTKARLTSSRISMASPLGNMGSGMSAGGLAGGLMGLMRGVSGAGIGLGASLAAILIGGSLIDGQKLKTNMNAILSIGDDMDLGTLAVKFGMVSGGLFILGQGMRQFGIGTFFVAGAEGLSNWISEESWSENLVGHVNTLLGLASNDVVSRIVDTTEITATLIALGEGLKIFGIGSLAPILADGLAQGIDWLSDSGGNSWSENLVGHVNNILALADGSIGATVVNALAVTGVLGLLGTGIAAFGLGSLIPIVADGIDQGIQWLKSPDATSWSENLVAHVNNILSLASNNNLALLGDASSFVASMTAISAGILAFSLGKIVSSLGDAVSSGISWFTGDSWSESIVNHVENLMGIVDSYSPLDAAGFATTMGAISAGLIAFNLGGIVSSISSGIASWFEDGESWSENVSRHVTNLMGILDDVDSSGERKAMILGDTLTNISSGIVGFSRAVFAAESTSWLSRWLDIANNDWSKNMVDRIRDLSEITTFNFGSFRPREFTTFLIGLGEGIKAFSGGERGAVISGFVGEVFGREDWAKVMVDNVQTITSLTETRGMSVSRAGDVRTILTDLGHGIASFADSVRGNDEGIFSRFGTALGNFFLGDDSPIGKLQEAVSATGSLGVVTSSLSEFNREISTFIDTIMNMEYDRSQNAFANMADDIYQASAILQNVRDGFSGGGAMGGLAPLQFTLHDNIDTIKNAIGNFQSDDASVEFIQNLVHDNPLIAAGAGDARGGIIVNNIDNSQNTYSSPVTQHQNYYTLSAGSDSISGTAIP